MHGTITMAHHVRRHKVHCTRACMRATLHVISLQDNTALLVINFPHNPTGYLPPDEDFHRLIQLCRERNIFVFSDEMYRFTNSDGTEPFPSVAQLYEKSLSLFGVSKTFGLPGLRIGWMASQDAGTVLDCMLSHWQQKRFGLHLVCLGAFMAVAAISLLLNAVACKINKSAGYSI